jgi:hypothetical protein
VLFSYAKRGGSRVLSPRISCLDIFEIKEPGSLMHFVIHDQRHEGLHGFLVIFYH